MSGTETPPFRADHVGSLLRPPALTEARADYQAGKITADALRKVEDAAIADAVAMQEGVGLKAITDGEFRRTSWHMDFLYQIGGVTRTQGDGVEVSFQNEEGGLSFKASTPAITGKLTLDKTIFGEAFAYLKSVVKSGTPKLTIPSPSMLHYRGGDTVIDRSVYPDLAEFWHDLGAVYADEIARLGELGCSYLQMDDTSLAYLNDPAQRRHVMEIGGDPDTQHLKYIEVFNSALARKPADMTVCTHLCRGNFRSSWAASGSYDHVADALFNQLNVDGYFLEFDDERSGGFEPLRFVPKGKRVVLGVITTKRAALESRDFIKRRIEEASKFVPLEQICLSPQCGFSSTHEGNDLTFEDQAAKLRLVVDVAKEIWG